MCVRTLHSRHGIDSCGLLSVHNVNRFLHGNDLVRARQALCINCGEPGHYANQCSAKTKSIRSSFNSHASVDDSSDFDDDDSGSCDDY